MTVKEALKATLVTFFFTALCVLFSFGIVELANIWSEVGALIVFVVVAFIVSFIAFMNA